MNRIYLDHAATTPLDKRVLKEMQPYFSEKYGNASSLHFFGTEAREAMEKSRDAIAKAINARPEEIVFTSGGTESDNIAVKGVAFGNKKRGKRVITSKIEHHAISHTCQFLEKDGFEVSYLNVDKEGSIDLAELEKEIGEGTTLVSVMHANNEIGAIQPVKEIGKLCREKGIYFHTDAVQSVGKERIDVEKMGIDLLSASGHKFYGPKGIGFLYARKGTKIHPLMHGGGHEKGIRPGTENVAGIVGMAAALKIAEKEREKENARERKLAKKLVNGALKIENSWLNGPAVGKARLSNNVNLGFDFVEGESIVLMLSDKGIAASTGSACSTRDLQPSHVLRAIGLPHVKCHGSLRLTLGRGNTGKDIDVVLKELPSIVKKLREISPLRKGVDISEFEEDVEHTHKH
ncbi:MAG: cysteine desulfurase NifS [Candidatus Diapherotrites archaeon]|uniref:Cysteine desulfurase IscS n=1 Tax=Candidatus Iainarchaeum sp. TaxID=3101447 RepID=A0A938YX49_9ARCH|nr:cysteine desulfurase NifS [Candidatus Diapherotrites archaeon]